MRLPIGKSFTFIGLYTQELFILVIFGREIHSKNSITNDHSFLSFKSQRLVKTFPLDDKSSFGLNVFGTLFKNGLYLFQQTTVLPFVLVCIVRASTTE